MLKRFTLVLMLVLMIGFACVGAQAAIKDGYNMPYYIDVDIVNQVVTVYRTKDDVIVRQMMCSTGKNDATPTGEFYMPDKERNSERTKWYTFYNYDGPGVYCYAKYASRIYNSILFHSLTYADHKDSQMNAEDVKAFGTPASHGCIRLLVEDAKWIAENCLKGTYVKMHKEGELDEDLREILYVASYTNENGMSYERFMGITDEEGALGRYSQGEEVSDLQTRLRDLGYYSGEITGGYGIATLTAVKQLQDVIYSEDAPVSTELTLDHGSSGPVVKQLQNALTTLGLYKGPIDSVYDMEVADAVCDFQSAYHYEITGVADPEVQQAIYYELSAIQEALDSAGDIEVEVISEAIDCAKVVSEARIIIRERASTSSDELDKVSDGDTVYVLDRDDDWTKVRTDSDTGYMRSKYLEYFTQYNIILKYSAGGEEYSIGHTLEEYADGAEGKAKEFSDKYISGEYDRKGSAPVPYVTVNTGSDLTTLNLRSDPDGGSEIVNTLANGTQLRALSIRDGWTLVVCNGQIGYLMNDYLEFWEGRADALDPEDEEEDDVIELEEYVNYPDPTAEVVADPGDDTVNLYKYDRDDARILLEIPNNMPVDILKIMEGGEWVRVSYKGYQGYMKDDNLRFIGAEI